MAETRKAVVFGGYPDFLHLRDHYETEEPDDDENAGSAGSRREARCHRAREARSKLQEEFIQLRLQYNALLHLVREHFTPRTVSDKSSVAPRLVSEPRIRVCTCEEMQKLLADSGGWQGLTTPVMFQAPEFDQPFTSREKLLSKGFRRDFPVATVLGDGLAAQFGPDWLIEGQTFDQCVNENCFSQVQGHTLEQGPLRDLWDAIPEWMRCSMVVLSTGPGGTGVAFHKHSSAWLVLLEGTKHWWLYPPSGPPTSKAYRVLALCAASQIAETVEKLPIEDRPIEITQRPGYGVFVPALWWHATYNVGATLGVGSQHHVIDLNFSKAIEDHSESGFVQFHYGCEIHKSNPVLAATYFEKALCREPLNFYYGMNQLRFYLNLVLPPKQTLDVIHRILDAIDHELDAKRRMLVLRFIIPSLFDFVEWNKDHDRLIKYSLDGCLSGLQSLLQLTTPYLPGGCESRFTLTLPGIEHLRYASKCSQCGSNGLGKAGESHSIWAHKFFCFECIEKKQRAKCSSCGLVNRDGQMGHAGTDFAKNWYCVICWKRWKKNAADPLVGLSKLSSTCTDTEVLPLHVSSNMEFGMKTLSHPASWDKID